MTTESQPLNTELRGAETLASAQAQASELSALLEVAKAASAGIAESLRVATQAATDAQLKLAEVTNTATLALAAKTHIADAQGVIATKSDHIQDAQEHADKVRSDLDRASTAATKHATDAEGMATRATTAADSAVSTLAEIAASKASALVEATAATAAKDAAKAASDAAKALAEKSTTIEERIAAYEERLSVFESEAAKQLGEIVRLLPGATSAGLAFAFDDRRKSFLEPAKRWQWLFVGSVVCLVLLAASGLWSALHAATAVTYDELVRLWLARLPIAAALVWLALHSSREAALAKRLEEDYGYKAVVASSFQGFHQQMEGMAASAGTNTALSKLCEDTLATIAAPPGRIYDKHRLTATPAGEVGDAARAAVQELSKATTSAK